MAEPVQGGMAVIPGTYVPLSRRLLEYGKAIYGGDRCNRRFILWVFAFYDASDECPVCKHALSGMIDWFNKFGLVDNPSRCIGFVLEDEPASNMIFNDLKFPMSPVTVFADPEGRVLDIIYEFPDGDWMDRYILPIIQKELTL